MSSAKPGIVRLNIPEDQQYLVNSNRISCQCIRSLKFCGIRICRNARTMLLASFISSILCLTLTPFLSLFLMPISGMQFPRSGYITIAPPLPSPVVYNEFKPPSSNNVAVPETEADNPRAVSAFPIRNFQLSSETFVGAADQTLRQKAVVDAFKHAWTGYKKFAWGRDELRPISKRGSTWFDLGLTIVDSLDTMWIMNLEEEFAEARGWVESTYSASINRDVNLFETTIRVLGGFLSAYTLTEDPLFLEKAIDLGDRLLPAFSSNSKVPYSDVNLLTGKAHAPRWGPDSSTSEVSTIQLEFRELSRLTDNRVYRKAVDEVSDHIHSLEKYDGLVPYFINANSGVFSRKGMLTLGARADSYYEYLLKQFLQTRQTEERFKLDFVDALNGMNSKLFRKTRTRHHLFIGESSISGSFSPKMDHLVCYFPGTLALAAENGFQPRDWYLELAVNITETCYQTYRVHATGLAPEISYFTIEGGSGADIYVKPNDRHNLLRPETIESLFYLYRITGDTKYQDWGWNIFQAFEEYSKVPTGGYSSIGNVDDVVDTQMSRMDKMESFFLGETLKYLFLLFDDSRTLLPLDKYIFNTEAHPLPVFDTGDISR